MSDIAISVKNMSKCYRVFDSFRSQLLYAIWPRHTKGAEEIRALSGIDFEIRRGEAVAIIGRNGSGKSTLLEILTGTLLPSEGQVTVNGRVAALLELGSSFNPEYSGRDNVIMNGLLLGLRRAEIINRFNEILEFSEIGDAIDRRVKTYSSGMMMRLAFAVQILSDPDILIIDEALSVGDFFFQQKCLGYIRNLSKKKMTLIFVSHDMGVVENLCARTIYLSEGKKVYDGMVDGGVSHYLGWSKEFNEVSEPNLYKMVGPRKDMVLDYISSPIWICPAEHRQSDNSKILAIGLYDKSWLPRTKFNIGEKIHLMVLYENFCKLPVHVGATFKNKYDIIINATTSYNLGIHPPNLPVGALGMFIISPTLNFEAGEYSISFSLGLESKMVNQGEKLFETPALGPLEIMWNYDQNIAPFLGPLEYRLLQNLNLSITLY